MLTLTRIGSPLADPLHLACTLASDRVMADTLMLNGFEADWTLRWQGGSPDKPMGHWFVIADMTISALACVTAGDRYDEDEA